MKYLLIGLMMLTTYAHAEDKTLVQVGEKIQCERYLDTLVRCTANGVTCYEDEETGARYCFTDIATIKL